MNWVWLKELNDSDRASESVEQDQTARMCKLILRYTSQNITMDADSKIRIKVLNAHIPFNHLSPSSLIVPNTTAVNFHILYDTIMGKLSGA